MRGVRFQIEQRFPGPLAQVEDALVDPAYIARLSALPKLGAPELLDRTVDGELVLLSVRYRFVGEVSPAVRTVVDPARLGWIEESTLDRRTHVTTWTIVPDHYGGLLRCAGTYTLQAAGDVTIRVADADIKVSVPLVGGKVERAIISGLREHAEAEEAVMAAHLAAAA